MATMKDIAEKAAVSTATVSRVLNNDSSVRVRPDIRNKVLLAADQLGYRIQKTNKESKNTTYIIAIADFHLVPHNSFHPNYDFLYEIVKDMKIDKRVVFRRIDQKLNAMVDAVIAFGPMTKAEEEKLAKIAPVVLYIDHRTHSYTNDTIIVDYKNGMQEVYSYLSSCKKIGYIGGIGTNGTNTIGKQRIDTFKEILLAHQKLDETNFLIRDIDHNSGWQLIEQALRDGNLCDGYLIGQEFVAMGAIEALKQYKKYDSVKIVVYRDIPYLQGKAYPKVLNMFSSTVWKSAIHMIMEKLIDKRIESLVVYAPPRLES